MDSDLPIFAPDADATYQLEFVAELTGSSSKTILLYQEEGLVKSDALDDEAVRKLRQIEHLRATFEIDRSGLKLVLDLMEQVERLQQELRERR
jgi:DNA-binding transcriptional MerR regulator